MQREPNLTRFKLERYASNIATSRSSKGRRSSVASAIAERTRALQALHVCSLNSVSMPSINANACRLSSKFPSTTDAIKSGSTGAQSYAPIA